MKQARHRRVARGLAALVMSVALLAAGEAQAQVVRPPFDGSYSVQDLGAAPGVPTGSYGGLVLKPGTTDRLLLSRGIRLSSGALYEIGLTRDAEGRITGFAGTGTRYADAAEISGGLDVGPGGVLFLSRSNSNALGQTKPGSAITDKIIPLEPLGMLGVSGVRFVPPGLPGAGSLKLSDPFNRWYDASVAPDGSGTYDLLAVSQVGAQLLRTREATSFDYVRAGSPEFADPAVLVSQTSAGTVAAYDLDADGNPVPATLRAVVEGLGSVTGGYTDPVSGDYLFTAGEHVYVLHGFAAPTATLTVVKHVINDGGGTLEAGSFNIHVRKGQTDVNGSPQPGSETGTVFHVPGTGAYTVTEAPVDGYARSFGGDCDATGSVTLGPGESKTCVLTNDDVEPKLTVVKHVVNDSGGTASAGDWTMHIMAGDPLMDVNFKSPFPGEEPGTERTLSAGTFVVSESGGPEGYAATIGGACAPDGTITLALADTASCTITNNDIGPVDAPTLKLIKHVVNDDGGTKSASDFSLHVKGGGLDVAGSPQPGSSSGTGYTLEAGTYGVSEDAVAGYVATFSGDCDAQGQVALAPSESKTCTITNDDIAPTPDPPTPLVRYGASGYRYTQLDDPLTPSDGFEAEGYDDSAWSVGQAPFGSVPSTGLCPLTPVTNWDAGSDLLVRRHFTVPASARDVTIHAAVDNDVTVWVNGHNVSDDRPNTSGGCAVADNVGPFPVAPAYLHPGADNVLAVRAHDYGGEAYLDLEVTGVVGPATPSLHVVKQVINDDGGSTVAGDVSLHVKSGGLDVTGSPQPGSSSGTSYTLEAGTYGVSEDAVAGYAATFSGDCDAQGQITLASGESKTCTLTNDDIAPTLTVVKRVVNDDGGSALAADWTMHIRSGLPLDDVAGKSPFAGAEPGVTRPLAAGSYVVSESGGPAGYAASISGDCNVSGQITLAPGESKTCTITNDDIAPTLGVVKHVVNDDGGAKVAGDFSLHVKSGGIDVADSPQPGSSGGTSYTLEAGTYGVSEDAVAGYSATFSGDCDAQGQVALAPGESKTCTITNDDSSGRIQNGHFERPVLPEGVGFITRNGNELDRWTVEGEGVDHIPEETWVAAEGRQSVDLNALGPGSVWQDVATEPGASYTLRFSMAANVDPGCAGPAILELAVSWAGAEVAREQFDRTGRTQQDPGWEDRTVAVRASGTTTRLGFKSLTEGACGPALDFVRLEPAETPPAAKLTVLRNDEAGGDVASGDDPKTIDCGATCSATYPDGTEVVLTPTPKPGWKFTGWEGAACAGSPPQCTLKMNGDQTITAKFERITHQLHVERLGNGSGTVESVEDPRIACGDTCDAPYDEGSSVTLRATPETGHRFIGWRGAGCSGIGDCTITVDVETTVEAIFVEGGPLTWSLARDFRTSFDKPAANPIPDANAIPGVWSLGYSDAGDLDAVRAPSRYNLLSQRKTDANQSLVWTTPGNLGTDISMAEDAATFAWPHIVQVTPYGDRLQVVGWRSPVTGHVRVEGGLTGAPGGDGVRWFVTKDEAELAGGAVGGGNCETQSFADGAAGASLAEIAVVAGETLYFVIDPRGPGGTNEGPDIPSLDVNISEVDPGAPPPVSGRWDLAHDMRRAPIQQNDNLDSYGFACAWRFERGDGVSHDASTTRLVTMTPALAGIAGFEGWTGQYPGAVNLLYPVIGMNTGEEFEYEGFTVPSGRVLVHPEPEHTAIVRWRSPFTGFVKVTGAATDLDPDSGDGVLWTIDRNTTTLAEGAAHNSSQAFALAAVPVVKGDTLAFIVAPGEAGYFDDTTQLDVVIERIPQPQRALTVLLAPADGEGGRVTSGDNPKTIDCAATCRATYPDGTEVVLTPTAKPGWKFVRWEGACSGTGPCRVAMTEPGTVTAVFEREQHELTVEIRSEREGSGRVDSSDGKIDCDPRCVESYPHGTSVTLRHHAAQSSRFVGWVGGGCTALGDCVVQVDAAKKVVARFVKLTRLYVQVEPQGGGTVSATPGGIDACTSICHADYDAGTAVTIEAKPAPGWRFVRYADHPCGTVAKCELEMEADRTVTARFERIDPPQQLVVDVVPPNAGRVTTNPPGIDGCQTYCRATFPNGTAVALHAQELPGYRFKRLTSSSCPATSRDCALTMNQSRFVTAEFEKVGGPYKLTVLFYPPGGGQVRVEPSGGDCVAKRPIANWGSVHCRYQFAGETPVVMEATPKPGHVFRRWILGPCNNSRARRCAFTLTKNEDTTAEFVKTGPIKAAVGQTGVSQALRGTVTYRPPTTPGRAARVAQAADEADDLPFFPLDRRQAIPVGSTIDATAGALRLTVRNARGRQEQIDLSGGMFVFRQAAKGRQRGRTFLELPNPCAAPGTSGGSQRLKASGGGGFVIRGAFSESTTRRATWTTEDRCDGTKTKVSKGKVIVRDLKKRRAVTLRAGRSHTARASRR